ncbi:MAG: calcium/sodium antiporter [Gammaproteobacteria bacterium]
MISNIFIIIAGFSLLAWGAERLVAGAVSIAKHLGISPLIIGLTIVALGTSAPEIFISISAALRGYADIAIGNVIGSNIANIGLVLGIAAIVAPIQVQSQTLRREYPILFLIMLLALILMIDGELSRIDGLILISCLVILLIVLVWLTRRRKADEPLAAEYQKELSKTLTIPYACLWLIVGLIILPLASRLTVYGAVNLAQIFGISELIIGLTIVAIGTSLPEVATSIIGALKGEYDLAIGNILGSNMFNLLAVLAIPELFQAVPIATSILSRDIPFMFGFTIALFLVAYGFRGPGHITRFEGSILLLSYIAYLSFLVYKAVLL